MSKIQGDIPVSVFENELTKKTLSSIRTIKKIQSNNSAHLGFLEGFMIAILNPKIAAWLLALFSQFVQPDFTWGERALVACIAMCIDGGWYVLVALIISGTPLMVFIQENARKVELAMGILLAGLGVWIVL